MIKQNCEKITFDKIGNFLKSQIIQNSTKGELYLYWDILDSSFKEFLCENFPINNREKHKILSDIIWLCKNQEDFNDVFGLNIYALNYQRPKVGTYYITFKPFNKCQVPNKNELQDNKTIEGPLKFEARLYYTNTDTDKSKLLEKCNFKEETQKEFQIDIYFSNAKTDYISVCFGECGFYVVAGKDENKKLLLDYTIQKLKNEIIVSNET